MIEQVKMLMDEQSREALQRVRADFEEILRPLNLLNDLRQRLDSLAESQEESANAVQKKVRDIEDALVESKQAVDGVTEGGRLLAMRLSEVGNDLSYDHCSVCAAGKMSQGCACHSHFVACTRRARWLKAVLLRKDHHVNC